MRLAYVATNLPEAQLIADLLQAAGVDVRVFNQNAQSAAGEIPPAAAGPQVWVMEDARLQDARALIGEFQRRPAPGSRRCPHCNEENPTTFLSCWSCGAALP